MDSILIERARAARRRRPLVSASKDTLSADRTVLPAAEPVTGRVDPRLLARALTIRRTEERLLSLFGEGKLFGTVHTCIGQEWVGVAVADSLVKGDYVFSNHRGHGHYLARTDDVEGLLAELMGRTTGVCGGWGGSQHLCRDGFFSNGIQGGIVPVAAGLAMAGQLTGSQAVAVVFIGDGTLGEGLVYETLNIAALWSLPLLVVVEDNGVAQSTPQQAALAGSVIGRAQAFGVSVYQADTWQPANLIAEAGRGVRFVRETRRPALLHVRTYRLKAHSKGDDDRDPAEVARFAAIDPLNVILAEGGAEVERMLAEIDLRIEAAVQAADGAPLARVTSDSDGDHSRTDGCTWREVSFEPRRVVDAIRGALADAMTADERIVLIGEDIRDPYGGAFKATAGLSDRFGDRVRSTPIAEAAIAGLANGLALAGRKPVAEIMFGDFLLLAADQFVNHAAKFAGMYNHQVSVPLVIRTPMGGYRGYGPTHSQSLEKHLLGVPGTRVLAVHPRWCPGELYRSLLASNDRPTLVIENKLLYGRRSNPVPPPGCTLTATGEPFPTIRIRPAGACQLTIVAYGGMVELVEAAIAELGEDEEVLVDFIIPTQLYPLDVQPIVESVRQTRRLLVVEEGQGFAGFGGELIAQVAGCEGIRSLRAGRVCAAACPIPAARPAEAQALPGAADIVRAAVRLVTAG